MPDITQTEAHPWTLYDTERDRVWGGTFKSEGQARRWRNNAELPVTIRPLLIEEARALLAVDGLEIK